MTTATTVVRVKGIPLELGGTTYIVPPLSLGALEQLKDALEKFTGDIRESEQVSTVIDAATAALKRNYPEFTREQVADLIDLENMQDVFLALMDVSGLRRKKLESGEGDAPGEAKAE